MTAHHRIPTLMKFLLPLLAAVSLSSCSTSTTVAPDGSKTVVTSVDPNAWLFGDKALDAVVITSSGK